MSTQQYDLVGDIHGQYDKLIRLLAKLGYLAEDGTFRHPEERKIIFLGDYIDRGPRIRDTLHLVRSMVNAGNALAIMGNHEFNAVAFAAPDGQGGYLRPHTVTNMKQHAATMREFEGREEEWGNWLQWMRRLPMYLDLGELRAVHACWAESLLPTLAGTPLIDDDFLQQAARKGTPQYHAVETVLKGPELALPDGITFLDKEDIPRDRVRARWWALAVGQTIGEIVMPQAINLPELLTHLHLEELPQYPAEAPPVFFGHYWLPPTLERKPLGENIICLDYSAGLGPHPLTAYRWDGRSRLTDDAFITALT